MRSAPECSRWPSSAGPTSASRRCSTGSSARTAPSCTTCRAPPATPSTPWSRPTTGRSASSTPPACAARRRIDEGTEYYSLVRALQAIDDADVALLVIDATEGVTHQDQRLAERVDAAGCPIVVLLNKWELLDAEARADVIVRRSADRLHFLGDGAGAEDPRAHRQGRAQAAAGAGRRRSTAYQPRVPDPGGQRGHPARPRRPSPRPHGARVLYATQGATDPPTFTLFANRELPPHLPALPRAPDLASLRPRRHPDQAAGAPPDRPTERVALIGRLACGDRSRQRVAVLRRGPRLALASRPLRHGRSCCSGSSSLLACAAGRGGVGPIGSYRQRIAGASSRDSARQRRRPARGTSVKDAHTAMPLGGARRGAPSASAAPVPRGALSRCILGAGAPSSLVYGRDFVARGPPGRGRARARAAGPGGARPGGAGAPALGRAAGPRGAARDRRASRSARVYQAGHRA